MNIQQAKQQIKDTVEAYLKRDDAGMFAIAPVPSWSRSPRSWASASSPTP